MTTSGDSSVTLNKLLKDIKDRKYHGANWNEKEDSFTQAFHDQNLSQFWRPEDISLQPDLNVWKVLSPEVRRCYVLNLLMLTYLDTYQGDVGMNVVSRSLSERFHQRKALINYMASMENSVHAPSYSNIFCTFITGEEIKEAFQWGDENKHLQNMLDTIVKLYDELDYATALRDYGEIKEADFDEIQYKALVASVNLESSLFYSGFYYPLYFYGSGKLMQAGEIINLIIRDESIHGLYISMLAKELYDKFPETKQKELYQWTVDLMEELYSHQSALISEIYNPVGLTEDVLIFARYNANKAIMSLGFDPIFEQEQVNEVVLNGLNTETKTMDNFSMKGNGYQKMKVESLKDEDFYFEEVR